MFVVPSNIHMTFLKIVKAIKKQWGCFYNVDFYLETQGAIKIKEMGSKFDLLSIRSENKTNCVCLQVLIELGICIRSPIKKNIY